MFKATLSSVDLLKNSIPIIAEIIDEGVFKVDQNGISMLSPDRTMVAVVDFKILSSTFDEYSVSSELTLGLNMANLAAVLRRVKSSDKLTLQMTEKSGLELIAEGNGRRRFMLPLLNITAEKPPIDQLKFQGKIEMESKVLEEGISDADVVSDSVILEAEPNAFRVSASSDISSTELELRKGETSLLNLEVSTKAKARYPLEYLKKMIKAGKLSKHVLLEFGTDYPMRLGFREVDKVSLSFILAPRVSE